MCKCKHRLHPWTQLVSIVVASWVDWSQDQIHNQVFAQLLRHQVLNYSLPYVDDDLVPLEVTSHQLLLLYASLHQHTLLMTIIMLSPKPTPQFHDQHLTPTQTTSHVDRKQPTHPAWSDHEYGLVRVGSVAKSTPSTQVGTSSSRKPVLPLRPPIGVCGTEDLSFAYACTSFLFPRPGLENLHPSQSRDRVGKGP